MMKDDIMKDDILKTLMGLVFLTLVLFASVGFLTMLNHLFVQEEIPEYESVEIERPEDVQRAIDLPLDPITAEEFENFKLLNGLAE